MATKVSFGLLEIIQSSIVSKKLITETKSCFPQGQIFVFLVSFISGSTEAILIATEKCMPELLQLSHIAENSKEEEKLQVELFEMEYDGSKISDSQ